MGVVLLNDDECNYGLPGGGRFTIAGIKDSQGLGEKTVEKLRIFLMQFACDSFYELPKGIGDVQKGAFSKAAGALARGAYGLVREHDKWPRTPMTPFFNIH